MQIVYTICYSTGQVQLPEPDQNGNWPGIYARFGEKQVSYDPTDPEVNERAIAEGYTVVHGHSLSREEWENVRSAGAICQRGR